ncbi:MAG: SDR family NAD(P)-dependent oxidoreductase, partial [Myxococcota bacterium]
MEEVPAPSAVDEDSVRAQVLDIIAKVSAFPKDSLRGEQRLVDELGFDSLMVADLGGAIESSFPSTGGLPPNLFGLETTVADIADHLVGQLGAAPPAAAAAAEAPAAAAAPAPKAKPSPKAPAARYRVIPRERPRVDGLPHDVSGETWLVTEDDSRLAGALGSALTERGARLVRVRFAKDGVAAPARLAFGTVNLWPEAFAEGLPQALSTAGVTLDGFIHAASLSAAAAGGEPGHPLKLLHPLASQLDVPRLAVVTALGGKLGLERSPTLSRNVLQAAALGYAKALGRERPHRVVRALDVDPRVDAGRSAKWVIEELLSPDRSPEAGFTGGQRIIPELAPVEAKADERSLGAQDVVLITGGAGEIGAQVAEWTARQKPKGVIVVGRRAADDAINGLLARLSEHGCTAAYVSADVTDAASLTAATRHVVQRIGQVSVVFHAAGIIEDAPAAKKSAESVERVVATKIRGAQAILTAFPDVRDLILFSSWAGRFGNAGQVDYSAANELLDRLAVATTGATRTVSIDWPPWTGTKMVESIPPAIRASLEQRGVTFLDPQEGLDILARIFSQNARGIELVGRNMPAREVSVVVRERFDLESHPYLADHRLNGRPVVPLASITDWIVAVARPFARGPIVIEDLNLTRGVMGDEQADLHIDGRIELDGRFSAKVEVRTPEGGVAYRASLWAPGDGEALQGIELGGAPRAAPLSLDAFYAEHTFHGPMLRGVKRLNRSTEHGISGLVRGSNPKDWWLGRERAWGADPLVLDGSFQLAGYWLHVQEGRAGFPVGFDRLTLLRPFGATVHCAVRLSELGTEGFSGDIVYTNAEGEILARLDGIRGRFAHLDADGSGTSDEAAPTSKEQNGAVASPPPAPPAEVTPVVSVPDEVWDVGRFPEVEALQQRFEMAKLVGLENPYFAVHAGTARDTSVVEGKELIHFSGYNYLGFSGRPEVVEAAQSAAAKFGTSVSASRVASGERPIHREFEEGVADHLGVEAAILYVGGHATNVTTVGHILDKDDLVVHDSLIHDSIFQGIKLSGAARRPYPHEDMEALDRILGQVRSSYRRVLIAAEGIYSMDGDICNLPRLIEL